MRAIDTKVVGVSSSKMAAVLNRSQYISVVEQYFIDTKQVRDVVTEVGRRKMEMGHVMEPIIKDLVEKQFGIMLTVDKTRYQHDVHDSFTVEFDALDYENEVVYEFKNTEKSEEEILRTYYPQVQFAMYMIGWSQARICYLKNGWFLGTIDIARDENFIANMVEAGLYYANCLALGVEPDIATVDEIANKIEFYKQFEKGLRGAGEQVDMTPEQIDKLYKWQDLDTKIDALEQEREAIKGEFADTYGKYSDGFVTFSNVEYIRRGNIDFDRLLTDHPDINIDLYKRAELRYNRMQLRVKRRKDDTTPIVRKVEEDIV